MKLGQLRTSSSAALARKTFEIKHLSPRFAASARGPPDSTIPESSADLLGGATRMPSRHGPGSISSPERACGRPDHHPIISAMTSSPCRKGWPRSRSISVISRAWPNSCSDSFSASMTPSV